MTNRIDSVLIKILSTDGSKVSNAKVVLTSKNNKSIEAKPDKITGYYVATELLAGRYRIEVSAKGLGSDARDVSLQGSEITETFVLGEEGLPYYYSGQVKVPFDPPAGLIAITAGSRDKIRMEKEVASLADELGLKPMDLPDSFREDGISVYELMAGASDRDRREIIQILQRADEIRQAGPVLSLDERTEDIAFLGSRITVKFKAHVDEDQVEQVVRQFGLDLVRQVPYAGNAYQFTSEKAVGFDLLELCQALVDTDLVVWAEPDVVRKAIDDLTPNDFLYSQQGHHQIIGSEDAWDITTGAPGIVLAGVDRGLDLTHPDFTGNVAPGVPKLYAPFDFENMDANPANAGSTHGARVCGILGANLNNSEGVAGLAPGCRLTPIRRPGSAPESEYADMYVWLAGFDPNSTDPAFPAVITPGADVISSSFGFNQASISGLMQEALDFITTYGRGGRGCVVVFSAGNDDIDFTTQRQWAAYGKTIAVSSSAIAPPDAAEVKVNASSFGPGIDLCAPGGGTTGAGEARTMSTSNVGGGSTAGSAGAATNDYQTFGQTSCACPQVSATAALMLSVAPALNWVEVRQILRDTAVIIDAANTDAQGQWTDTDGDGNNDYSQWYGFGRLDTNAAVTGAQTYPFDRDLVIRDNMGDDGSVPQGSPWWGGADLWVRNADPATEGAAALPANINTHANTVSQDPIFGQNNWVYARFQNIGSADSLNFYVRVYITHFAGAEFVYPTDFIPSNRPGDPVPQPLVPGTYLIGESLVNTLPAGQDQFVSIEWDASLVPPETVDVGGTTVSWHPCLLVEISPHDGPASTGPNVWDNNNLAQKNLSVVYPSGSGSGGDDDFAGFGVVGSKDNRTKRMYVEILREKLFDKGEVYVRFTDPDTMGFLVEQSERKGSQLKLGEFKGEKVLWLADKNNVTFEIPGFRLQGMIVGGRTGDLGRKDSRTIQVNQYDREKKPRGSFAIEVRHTRLNA